MMASEVASEASDSDDDEGSVEFSGGKHSHAREETPLLGAVPSTSTNTARRQKFRSFDEALEGVSVGVFHLVLVLVCGWAIASDSVEIQCISFVTPQLDQSNNISNGNEGYALRLNKQQEGILDAIIFLGMMVGGYVWGSLSDLIGRRSCLITSLTVNGVFGMASALSPSYPVFLVFRFLSGVGVGGSFPVVFSYFCEFFSRRSRGPYVIVLAAFWILGSVFAALMAWIVIGHFNTSIHSQLGAMTIEAWRVYVILCTFPCLSAALCMVFLPESPSFLFSKGKLTRAAKVLKKVQKVNSWFRRSKEVDSVPVWRSHLEDVPSEGRSDDTGRSGVCATITEVLHTTRDLFLPPHLRPMAVMLIIWFMYSFGYYGLLLWFPEYFKYVEDCNYQKDNNCSMHPVNPDPSCSLSPVQCNDTRDEAAGSGIYRDSLYVAMAAIPGTLLGILTVNVVGAKAMLVFSLTVSGLSSLLIWVIPDQQKTENVVVILSSVFGGVSIIGWNALDVVSTSELFPVRLRSTAFGIQSMLGRIGAITGNVSFGKLFATPYLPILLVASVLIFAGLSSLFLPTPRGEKAGCHRLRSLCSFCYRHCHMRARIINE